MCVYILYTYTLLRTHKNTVYSALVVVAGAQIVFFFIHSIRMSQTKQFACSVLSEFILLFQQHWQCSLSSLSTQRYIQHTIFISYYVHIWVIHLWNSLKLLCFWRIFVGAIIKWLATLTHKFNERPNRHRKFWNWLSVFYWFNINSHIVATMMLFSIGIFFWSHWSFAQACNCISAQIIII